MCLTLPSKPSARAGFTLIEVVLAIVIALGILVVLLFFYQQATNLRSEAIQQTEQITAARLLMDRMTSELRTAQAGSTSSPGFSGSSNAIQFIHTEVPSFASWTGGALGRSASPVSDLKVIRYELQSADGTNATGVLRSEEPLVAKHQAVPLDQPDAVSSATNAPAFPAMEEIRFLQFRYWTGTNWADSWSGSRLPSGVEVSLGAEPLTIGTAVTEYTGEVFRRIIYLAGNGGAPALAESVEPGTEGVGGGKEEAP